MAWTYTNDPVLTGSAAQQRDAVRFLAQENDTLKQRVSDEEIAFALANEANPYMAAAMVAESVATRLSGNATTKTVGATTITRDAGYYRQLASELRARGSSHQMPYVGGISVADKQALEENTDAVAPMFRRNLMDIPGSPVPSWGITESDRSESGR